MGVGKDSKEAIFGFIHRSEWGPACCYGDIVIVYLYEDGRCST
jgi:hypothetical protein